MYGCSGGGGGGRHMSASSSATTTSVVAAVESSSAVGGSACSFSKDVRKINVGDCALFKPPHDSPPFVGIIRSLASDKENNLKLEVNWLYRRGEVKLGKGVALEAAPNEVFYSFHRDEIPAASLLHPCKVAFLPKGVELPSGVSSFVCRRVYDITNKCLWWLTDRDYINNQQEEVDQLLNRTTFDMHATMQQQQQGGRSPKGMNGPISTSQPKNSPESMQTSTGPFPYQSKGKKRERSDQISEPSKRDRASRSDDGDVGHLKAESLLKSEIARITERGGLVNFEGVERLIQLTQCEKQERKTDWASRSLLTGAIAATDRFDCLSRFVQLRGLVVLDEWLQEIHKSKAGDSSSPKDSDKSVDEFLLVLLRALDKLPVNLNALQTCNIGKSVNHLRSHRNSEIQKKARSLVDTWKKRVEAEMNMSDTKSGPGQAIPWTARSRPEVSHTGNRQTGGPSEVVLRSSVTPVSSPRSAPVKLIQLDSNGKFSAASPGSLKTSVPASPNANSREGHPKMSGSGSVPEPFQIAARDERSSSSSHSHTNSQGSSEHGRNLVPSGKEDARSSTAGSMGVSKISGSASRYRKSPNGLHEASGCVAPKESSSSRNFAPVNTSAIERSSQLPLTGERSSDVPGAEANTHKLIVKIPNRGRSPAQSIIGGAIEDHSFTCSRANSPVDSEKHDPSGLKLKDNVDTHQNHVPSRMNNDGQSNDIKDVGSDVGDGSLTVAPDYDPYLMGENLTKPADSPKPESLSPGHEARIRKSVEASFSSINALIEASDKALIRDDVGMNLLASVAAGDYPSNSEEPCTNNGTSQGNEDDQRSRSSMSGKDLALTNEKVAGGEEFHEKKVSPNELATKEKDGSDGSTLRQETHRNTIEVSSLCLEAKVDDEKNNVNQGVNGNPIFQGVPLVSMKQSDEATIASGATKGLPLGSSNDLKVEDTVTSSMNASDRSDMGRKGSSVQQNVVSETLQKMDEACKGVAATESKKMGSMENKSSKEEPSMNLKVSPAKAVEDSVLEERASTSGSSDTDGKLGFDLNEGFNVDDFKFIEPAITAPPGFSVPVRLLAPMPSFSVPSTSLGLPASITVAAAAKGPFVPPEDLLRVKGEIGWKGSAATSAFRPAEPRKVSEMPPGTGSSTQPTDASNSERSRRPLEFDLNVADEGMLEDMGCENSTPGKSHSMSSDLLRTASHSGAGGLDLDLNKVDEVPELSHQSNSYRFELPFPSARLSLSSGISDNEASARRNFDLNNGPAVDESVAGPSFFNHARPSFPMQHAVRMNNIDMGNLSSWYPSGSSYSAVAIPSLVPDRGEQPFPVSGAGGAPQRIVGGPAGSTPFNPEAYRGTFLSSAAAMPFASPPFQYPVFPFGASNFPLPSSTFPGGAATYMDLSSGGRLCIPAVPSQLMGSATGVSSQFPRPYVVALPDNGNPAIDTSRKFGRQGLDLNSGPGVPDVEGRDETATLLSRQLPNSSSVSLTEEQARIYHVVGGVLKRKEPDGVWDGDRLSFKQAPWK